MRAKRELNLQWKHSSAVTLIELLVVTSIMALLASLMAPSLNRAREQARRTACMANLKHIGVALFTYASDHFDRGPDVMAPVGSRSNRSYLNWGGATVSFGRLWPTHVTDLTAFECPSAKRKDLGGSLEQMGTAYPVSGSYTYVVHIEAGQSPKIGASRHLALGSDNFTSWRHQDGHGATTHVEGYNILYTDGSSSWYADLEGVIASRQVQWDREGDEFTYRSLYDRSSEIPLDSYGSSMDIFRVWRAFCYNTSLVFPE